MLIVRDDLFHKQIVICNRLKLFVWQQFISVWQVKSSRISLTQSSVASRKHFLMGVQNEQRTSKYSWFKILSQIKVWDQKIILCQKNKKLFRYIYMAICILEVVNGWEYQVQEGLTLLYVCNSVCECVTEWVSVVSL